MSELTPDDILLGLLAAQACHGYQLLEHFRDRGQLAQVWKMSTSQLYAVLKRLEQQQLIVGQAVESGDAPTRTEYHLTETGMERLHAWLYEKRPSSSIRRVRVEFLSRLYVARLLNLSTAPIVRDQRAACRQRQLELQAQREQTEPGVAFLVVELMIAQLGAILQWIDRCELVPSGSEMEEEAL